VVAISSNWRPMASRSLRISARKRRSWAFTAPFPVARPGRGGCRTLPRVEPDRRARRTGASARRAPESNAPQAIPDGQIDVARRPVVGDERPEDPHARGAVSGAKQLRCLPETSSQTLRPSAPRLSAGLLEASQMSERLLYCCHHVSSMSGPGGVVTPSAVLAPGRCAGGAPSRRRQQTPYSLGGLHSGMGEQASVLPVRHCPWRGIGSRHAYSRPHGVPVGRGSRWQQPLASSNTPRPHSLSRLLHRLPVGPRPGTGADPGAGAALPSDRG